ncbi:MAG TPA: hypothetical protein VFY15_07540 [Acidimicrobiia bacterium]|nr:hypothetical protein [Acidimicrobiia bacterium]
MTDLRARETTRDDWEGVVVELVEENRVVGVAYLDDGAILTEFYPDEDGEPWVFDVADLQRVLDVAAAMLGIEEPVPASPSGESVDRLATEFDPTADHRGAEDEGFYPVPAALALTMRAEELGLAVVSLEGFTLDAGEPIALPGYGSTPGDAHRGEAWPVFRSGCNAQARAQLERWAGRNGLVVALEVADQSGETYVL